MQRQALINVIRRNQAVKTRNQNRKAEERGAWKEWYGQQKYQLRVRNQYVAAERQARREDWLAGPLAPDRNIGSVRGAYGAADASISQSIRVPNAAQIRSPRLSHKNIQNDGSVRGKKAFKGKSIIGNVVVNDRVVIVEGPANIKGRVGTVKAVNQSAQAVVLRDLNITDVATTASNRAFAVAQNEEAALFEPTEIPIPMKNVRLVYDMEDPRTREKKAVIIRHVHADGPYSARSVGSSWPSHTRYATGTGHLTRDGEDIRLDWPEEQRPSEIPRRQPYDTSRTVVEKLSWEPTMLHSPMCYPTNLVDLKGQPEALDGRYVAGVPPAETDVQFSAQRLGLHGFVNADKLAERQQRIAAGISAELRHRVVRSEDDVTHLKKKILEDARAIWWKERQVLSPAAEAAKKAAEARKQQRETQLPKPTEHDAQLVVDRELLESLQAVALKDRYKTADRRLTKRLLKARIQEEGGPQLGSQTKLGSVEDLH